MRLIKNLPGVEPGSDQTIRTRIPLSATHSWSIPAAILLPKYEACKTEGHPWNVHLLDGNSEIGAHVRTVILVV